MNLVAPPASTSTVPLPETVLAPPSPPGTATETTSTTVAAVAPPEPAPPSAVVTTAPPAPAPSSPPVPRSGTRRTDVGEPTRLRVPAIAVDTSIMPVGMQADGQMEVPPAALVGWYRLGPRPGAPGSAVLAAHIDYGGRRGAFFALPRVQVGNVVLVTESDGIERRYVVTERAQIAKTEVDLSRYFTNEGPARLTLITCGGVFNGSSGHYRDNIIITAVPA